MDVIKAESLVPDLKKILVLGVPFSGKTSFLSTCPKPMLIFAGDVSVERRLTGIKDVDIIPCYDRHGEKEGEGIRRLDRNFQELMCMKTVPYQTVAFDPFNFFYDDKFLEYAGLNSKDKRGAYGDLLEYGQKFTKRAVGLPCYVVVICHIKHGEDDTRGTEIYLPAIPGSIKNTLAGRFDAVFYTKLVPQPMKAPKYMLRALPSSEFMCGVKVPVGKESILSMDLEPDFTQILAKLRS